MTDTSTSAAATAEARETYSRLLTAWNQRDAHGFSALFDTDGVMIGYDGSSAEGRDDILGHLAPIFDTHPTATYVARVSDARQIGVGLVLLRARAGMVPPGTTNVDPSVNALHTIVVRRSGETASIVLFQNTPAQYHGRQDLSDEHFDLMKRQLASGDIVG